MSPAAKKLLERFDAAEKRLNDLYRRGCSDETWRKACHDMNSAHRDWREQAEFDERAEVTP